MTIHDLHDIIIQDIHSVHADKYTMYRISTRCTQNLHGNEKMQKFSKTVCMPTSFSGLPYKSLPGTQIARQLVVTQGAHAIPPGFTRCVQCSQMI